ncbi:uncharacterized protein LOC115217640 [Argonauta hians]
MSRIAPVGTRPYRTSTSVPDDIDEWTHAFVRNDGIPVQLCPPYSGPYRVLEKHPKYFVLEIKGKPNKISIDRLKKGVVGPPDPSSTLHTHDPGHTATLQPRTSTRKLPTRTKSGRRVHWPRRVDMMDELLQPCVANEFFPKNLQREIPVEE